MKEAMEEDRAEVERLTIELEQVKEELRGEREGAEGARVATTDERLNEEQEAAKANDLQVDLEGLALGGGA